MLPTTIDIHEAEERFSELISLVAAGNEVILADQEKPVVRLVPVGDGRKQRVPGLHAGMIWTSEDFDEPLPDEFWIGVP